MSIAENIIKLRKIFGVTQRELVPEPGLFLSAEQVFANGSAALDQRRIRAQSKDVVWYQAEKDVR